MRPRRRSARGRAAWLERLVPVGALLVRALLRLLRLATRRRLVGAEELFAAWDGGEQVIVAFWHERLVLMPLVLPMRGRRVCIMVSRHRDGELITRAVRPLGVETVRGSSTRGWAGGLKDLLRAHRRGCDLAWACDGPRGPAHVVKSGVIQMARATGARIFPVTAAARWQVRLGSWDRLVVPLPGSRLLYLAGRPLRIAPDGGPAEMAEARETLERELARITAEADAAVARVASPGRGPYNRAL